MNDEPSKTDAISEKGSLYRTIIRSTSDTSEDGLEKIIFEHMLARGWIAGDYHDYDRDACVDLVKLTAFLEATQPEIAVELQLQTDGPTRRSFLARLEKEIASRGVIDVLRLGVKHQKHSIDLF